jgi:NO-binding membrane sensor protein with MHYT domain
MDHLLYEYDIYLVFMAVLNSLVGTFTTVSLIQNIRYCHTTKSSLILIGISSVSLSALTIWTTHFLMIYSMAFKINVYIRIDYTIISLICSSICKVIGCYISFLPFLRRIRQDFEEVIQTKDTTKSQIDYSGKFMSAKLIRKDYICVAIGAIFIGPGIMLLHILGMLALKIEGEVDYTSNAQIVITIAGLFASIVVNFCFYWRDTVSIKIFLTCLISGAVIAIHCISIHFTSFTTNPSGDYSYLIEDKGLMAVPLLSKIVIGVSSFLSYIFREVSNYYLKDSWKIVDELGCYMKLGGLRFNYIDKYVNQYKVTYSTEMGIKKINVPFTHLNTHVRRSVDKQVNEKSENEIKQETTDNHLIISPVRKRMLNFIESK